MDVLEDFVKLKGFESLSEFHKLVDSVDLSSVERVKLFNHWKENDGTKEGLLKLQRTSEYYGLSIKDLCFEAAAAAKNDFHSYGKFPTFVAGFDTYWNKVGASRAKSLQDRIQSLEDENKSLKESVADLKREVDNLLKEFNRL